MAVRIAIDHRIMGGVPCVAGTRIPVATVVGLLGQGHSVDDVLADYSTLTREEVLAALQFAANADSGHVAGPYAECDPLPPA